MRQKRWAYYNENDAFAAEWLRNLIQAGHIAEGEVDERSIVDVDPKDVQGFEQAHFFAGISGWSLALRRAGWPDSRPVWTGSCPCQSFSGAGRQKGFADERHLWPSWFKLIQVCRPPVVLGEQVGSPLALEWLDLVSSDLEDEGYAFGAADLCAAGVGAPHLRQRLYFVADAQGVGRREERQVSRGGHEGGGSKGMEQRPVGRRDVDLADADRQRRDGLDSHLRPRQPRKEDLKADGRSEARDLADAKKRGLKEGGSHQDEPSREGRPRLADVSELGDPGSERGSRLGRAVPRTQAQDEAQGQPLWRLPDEPEPASPTGGFWADASWVPCRDGKHRAVESGTFPLASRLPGRVGRLRAYGNALCSPTAEVFIKAYIEARMT